MPFYLVEKKMREKNEWSASYTVQYVVYATGGAKHAKRLVEEAHPTDPCMDVLSWNTKRMEKKCGVKSHCVV